MLQTLLLRRRDPPAEPGAARIVLFGNGHSHVLATSTSELTRGGRYAVLAAAFLGLVFDGVELGLMPVASLSVTKSLTRDATPKSTAASGSHGSRRR